MLLNYQRIKFIRNVTKQLDSCHAVCKNNSFDEATNGVCHELDISKILFY